MESVGSSFDLFLINALYYEHDATLYIYIYIYIYMYIYIYII